jgi:hypothetical protein
MVEMMCGQGRKQWRGVASARTMLVMILLELPPAISYSQSINLWVWAIATRTDGDVFIGIEDPSGLPGVFFSTDDGLSWQYRINGLGNRTIHSLLVHDSDIVLAGTRVGAYRRANNGINWTSSSSGIDYPYVLSLARTPASGRHEAKMRCDRISLSTDCRRLC